MDRGRSQQKFAKAPLHVYIDLSEEKLEASSTLEERLISPLILALLQT